MNVPTHLYKGAGEGYARITNRITDVRYMSDFEFDISQLPDNVKCFCNGELDAMSNLSAFDAHRQIENHKKLQRAEHRHRCITQLNELEYGETHRGFFGNGEFVSVRAHHNE